jgi:hypothetical protein
MTKLEQNRIGAPQRGEFSDGGIRYMLIRPDVLMGLARELPGIEPQVFLAALERAAFVNGMRSFERYREQGRFAGQEALEHTSDIAASLGWGEWLVHEQPDGSRFIDVRNSPFAFGFGASSIPVCAPIVGILKVVAAVFPGGAAQVEEIACCSQGAEVCRFHLR